MAQYYDQSTVALTNSYVYFPFGAPVIEVNLLHDDVAPGNTIQVSRDGVNQIKNLNAGEEWNWTSHANGDYMWGIYLKYTTAAPNYRLETTEG